MKQMTLAASRGFEKHGRATRKAEFLARMEGLMPWAEFCALIEPHYPKAGNGRPPVGVERMLRMYCIANWFNLSDVACEDALYDVPVFREFCRIDLGQERVPDATTLMNFRHLLETHQLGTALFAKVGELLMANGMRLSGGTIVDATLIAAPPSTKNQHKARDREMHQTKKGNEWRFGMKCHTGVDAGTGFVHTVEVSSANVHDIVMAGELIREDDTVVYGDAGYLGIERRPEIAQDPHKSKIDYRINQRPGKINALKDGPGKDWFHVIEHQKSAVRCKVEHPYQLIKNKFGYRKVAYRGLAKNHNRLYLLFASANLWMCARSGGWRPYAV